MVVYSGVPRAGGSGAASASGPNVGGGRLGGSLRGGGKHNAVTQTTALHRVRAEREHAVHRGGSVPVHAPRCGPGYLHHRCEHGWPRALPHSLAPLRRAARQLVAQRDGPHAAHQPRLLRVTQQRAQARTVRARQQQRALRAGVAHCPHVGRRLHVIHHEAARVLVLHCPLHCVLQARVGRDGQAPHPPKAVQRALPEFVLPVDDHRAYVRGQEGCHVPQRGCLANARRADEKNGVGLPAVAGTGSLHEQVC
mmetsp:Transcript_51455/g.129091  ORF Transcript_51455/g.129091 Transcript_51455/m.129091 type:complete len:252 (-) Transcript_51455:1187-1942(-)